MGGDERSEDRGAALREAMVREQLVARGIRDPRVLAAFRKVRREVFVPGASLPEAHADHPARRGCRATRRAARVRSPLTV